MLNVRQKLLVSRFLTRMGDQAWDFAVPVTLAILFPRQLSLVAAIFFVTKAGLFLLQPRVAGLIDRKSRWHTAVVGVSLQFVSVFVVAVCLSLLVRQPELISGGSELSGFSLGLLACVALGSITSSLGSSVMDIAVGQDWLPLVVDKAELSLVNSQMKRIDLSTEVVAPLIAGLVLSMNIGSFPLAGLVTVACWNFCSFIPEILLLRSVFRSSETLKGLKLPAATQKMDTVFGRIFSGWGEFFRHPIALSMAAYSCLWLSVLSPHGVLLTSFLKGAWQVSEPMLGIFRAAGAVFGLSATFLFPRIRRQLGLTRACALFIRMQAVAVLFALVFFFTGSMNGIAFLVMILISRVGLYGFSIGESEIRQLHVQSGMRGKINGVASSLNSLATLLIFALGSLLTSHEQFFVLVIVSVVAVLVGSVLFQAWMRRKVQSMEAIPLEQKI